MKLSLFLLFLSASAFSVLKEKEQLEKNQMKTNKYIDLEETIGNFESMIGQIKQNQQLYYQQMRQLVDSNVLRNQDPI